MTGSNFRILGQQVNERASERAVIAGANAAATRVGGVNFTWAKLNAFIEENRRQAADKKNYSG